ncbi:Beta-glucosidase 4 [Vitis vinifera]|uniref:Beta-glucosidase 4 n=1 Tax=Vitis vinifera TaxID=29760 RepID=A0A438KRV0_VITVI|nr:Beta-glucosidase 4 [Vitis vinifera]
MSMTEEFAIVPITIVFFYWRLNYLSYSRGFALKDVQVPPPFGCFMFNVDGYSPVDQSFFALLESLKRGTWLGVSSLWWRGFCNYAILDVPGYVGMPVVGFEKEIRSLLKKLEARKGRGLRSQVDKQGGQIGLVVDCEWAEAFSDKIEDKVAAARRLDFQLGWYFPYT